MEMGAPDIGLRPRGKSTSTTPAGSTLAGQMARATVRKGTIKHNRATSTAYAPGIAWSISITGFGRAYARLDTSVR
jgi:hypothetical protein